MEIILREHIENLGRRGDVVTVANGYARNYLLPRKLALAVTETNRRQVERERAVAEAREAAERTDAEAVAASLRGVECTILRRVGETGTLYGSVTSADIAEQIERQGLSIDKRTIQLADPLKELGAFTVAVRVHRDVTAEITVNVAREDGDGEAASDASGTPASQT